MLTHCGSTVVRGGPVSTAASELQQSSFMPGTPVLYIHPVITTCLLTLDILFFSHVPKNALKLATNIGRTKWLPLGMWERDNCGVDRKISREMRLMGLIYCEQAWPLSAEFICVPIGQ